MNRDYPPHPLPGIGAVIWKGGDALMIRRAKPPRQGQWSLPGGLQEIGETVSEAARREVLEETGVTATIIALIDVFDAITRDAKGRVRTHYTLIDLWGVWSAGQPEGRSDALEAAWKTADDIRHMELWADTRRAIDMARRLYAADQRSRKDSLTDE